jgi:Cu-Zn family superoxide dismutase
MKCPTLLALSALLFATTLGAQARPGRQAAEKKARAEIRNAKGEKIGEAILEKAKEGVKIKLHVSSLPPGEHALHIHAVAKCDPPDFKTAGPHFNPESKKHGTKNAEGPHAGDLPNFVVAEDGHARVSITATRVTLGKGRDSVFHPDGTSLVVHEKPDDYATDPAGNAGARIACGVIQK